MVCSWLVPTGTIFRLHIKKQITMSNQTQPYKRSIAGSVGAGMKSVFGGGGRRFYTLVHKVSSRYHQAGESQQIIVDQIELGRDPSCQVRFDESFTTVSRRHAAIVKDGDNWKLVQLSKTNSTYLNGHHVHNEWYLQNGDEIQLSTNGPKLGFIIPEGKSGLVSSINLTSRLNLFRQQALRPYKTALSVLSCVLVVSLTGLLFWNYSLKQDVVNHDNTILALEEDIEKQHDTLATLRDKNLELEKSKRKLEKRIADMTTRLDKMAEEVKRIDDFVVSPATNTEALEACADDTYFCMFLIEYQEGSGQYVSGGTGTSFLLDDGRLVTAQHVVNPFMAYPADDNMALLNAMMVQQPECFTCYFEAVSPKGDKISYKWPMTRQLFNMGDFPLKQIGTYPFEGLELPVKCVDQCDYRDYAWIQTDKKGSLHADASFSKSMPVKTHLDILGFPQGVGAEDMKHISPIYSESYVAREGLDVDGCILLSNSETDHGNSGGPVLAVKDGNYVVVGILSGANRLGSKTGQSADGKWKDRVVPISAIY